MKKSFITKRFLALLLASAMVITSVPEVALAAGIDEDTVAADAAVEEEVFEEGAGDVIEPDNAWDDMDLRFKAGTNVTMHNAYDGDTAATIAGNSLASAMRKVDSEQGWSFYIEPSAGYSVDVSKPIIIKYYDWSTKTAAEWAATTPTLTEVEAPGASTYTVESAKAYNGKDWTKVTISSTLLGQIKTGMSTSDGTKKVTVTNADPSDGTQIAHVYAQAGKAGEVPIIVEGIHDYAGQLNTIAAQKTTVGGTEDQDEWSLDLSTVVKASAAAALKSIDKTKIKVFYGVGSNYESAAANTEKPLVAVSLDDVGTNVDSGEADENHKDGTGETKDTKQWWLATSTINLGVDVATDAVTAYASDAKIFVILDYTAPVTPETEYFTATVYDNSSKGFVTFGEGTTVNEANEKVWDTANKCANLNYVFGAKVVPAGGTGTRAITKVEYSVDGGKTKVDITADATEADHITSDAPATDPTDGIVSATYAKKYTIKKEAITSKNLIIYFTTTETLKNVKGTGYETYADFVSTSVSDATVYTGSDYSFVIRPTTGYELTDANYKIGNSTNTNPLTITVDGTFEGTISNVQETITFTVGTTAKVDGTKQKVTIGSGAGAGEISTKKYVHYDIENKDGTPAELTTDGADLAPLGKPFLFTVAPRVGVRYTVKNVTYTMKDASGNVGSPVALTPIAETSGTYTFKTAKVTGDVEITIPDTLEATILAPVNTNVTVAEVPKSTTALTDTDFAFSVTPVSSTNNISVRENGVKYTWSGGSTINAAKNSAGKYVIKKADLQAATLAGQDVQIQVLTDEEVTSGFFTEWRDSADTYTYVPDISDDYGDRTNNHIQNVRNAEGKITSQNLVLAMYEETDGANAVTVTFDTDAVTKGSKGTLLSTHGTDFAKEDGKLKAASGTTVYTASKTGTEDDFTVSASTGAITLKNVIANATLTATHTITGRDRNGDALADNNLIYKATLPITVVPHYESFRVAATSGTSYAVADEIDANKVGTFYSYLHILGKNARTGVENPVTIDSEVTEIKWATSPEFNDDDLTKSFKLWKGTAQSAAYDETSMANINVQGIKAGALSISATVKGQAGKTTSATDATVPATAKDFSIVANETYHIYPTVEVIGGVKDVYAAAVNGTTQTKKNGTFELEAYGELKNAQISYKIYKEGSDYVAADIASESAVKAAIANGHLVPVTPDSVTAEIKNYTANDGASLSSDTAEHITSTPGSKGEFTITAISKPATATDRHQVKLTAVVNKVKVTEATVYFSVVNNLTKKNVLFELANEGDYVVGGTELAPTYTMTAFDLSSDYKTSLKSANSVVNATADNASWSDLSEGISTTTLKKTGIQTSVLFTEISQGAKIKLPTAAQVTGNKGAKWTLAGWQSGSTYYAPGEEVVITKAGLYDTTDRFVAVWRTQYRVSGIYNGNMYTTGTNGTKTYTDQIGSASYNVAAESNIPVVLKIQKYDGMLSTSAKADDDALPSEDRQYNDAADKYGIVSAGGDLWANEYLTTGFTLEQATAGVLVDKALKDANSSLSARKALDTDLVIDGYAIGSTKIKATYTAGGASYKYVTANNVNVTGEHSFTLKENDTDFVNKTIYVGATNSGISTGLTADGAAVASSDYDEYRWDWVSGDTNVLKVEADTTSGNENKAKLTAVVAGTTTLTLTVTDKNGKTATGSVDVTVKSSEITWTLADGETDITAAPAIEIFANDDSPTSDNDHKGVINVKVDGAAGTLTAAPKVAAEAASDYSKIIYDTITPGSQKTDGSYDVPVYSGQTWGTTTITLSYTTTTDSRVYTKDVEVKVYKTVTFSNTPETGTGEDETTNNGVPTAITGSAGTVLVSDKGVAQTVSDTNKASKDVVVKVYKDQVAGGKLDFALTDYTAQYYDATVGSEKVLTTYTSGGWNVTGQKLSQAKKDKLDLVANLDANDGTETNVTLVAYLQSPSITNLTVRDPQSKVITLSDEVTTATATPTKPETTSKVVKIGVEPYGTKAQVKVTASAINIFTLGSGAANGTPSAYTYGTTPAFSVGTGELLLTAADPQGTNRVDSFTVGMVEGKAGSFTLTVSGGYATDQVITVNINGATKTGASYTGYYEDGNLIKGEYRSVGGRDMFFDATGAPIIAGGIYDTKSKDGVASKVLLIAGTAVAPATRSTLSGRVSNTDAGVTSWYYLNDKSELLTGWLDKDGKAATAATGLYYADPETGKLATDEAAEIDGVTYQFNKSSEIIKAPEGTEDGVYVLVDGAYVDNKGTVAPTGINKVKGTDGTIVSRLFREDGTIVSYADSDVVKDSEGIGKIPVKGITYVIDKDTNAASEDDKKIVTKISDFTWTPASNKEYKKDSVVTATATIEYQFEKAGTKGSDSITAKVVLDTAKSTNTKKVYIATIEENGYYKDGTTPYDFSKASKSITYSVDEATGDGKTGGIEIVGLDTSDSGYDYTGAAVKPVFTVVDNDRDVVLASGVDYTLTWKDNKKPGTATVTVNGKGNYEGKTIIAQFKIVDRFAEMTDKSGLAAGVKKITIDKNANSFVYDGTEKFPKSVVITTTDGATITYEGDGTSMPTTSADKDVVLAISNNINKGSATVTAVGADTKVKKATFKIAAAPLASTELTWTPDDAAWAVKGATTNINAKYGTQDLVLGQDYTVKWSYATKGKDAGEKAGKFVLTGKGNFTGKSAEGTFDITAYALDKDKISVAAYAGANGAKLKVTVCDDQGVLIPAKALSVTSDESGKLTAGQDINVTVKGITATNISGEEDIAITVAENLGSAKVKFSNTKYAVEYTGEPIDLENMENFANPFEDGMITVTGKTAGTLTYGTDFVITGYQNNIKKGTMKVTLTGISEKATGTKIVSIKIKAKTMKKAD